MKINSAVNNSGADNWNPSGKGRRISGYKTSRDNSQTLKTNKHIRGLNRQFYEKKLVDNNRMREIDFKQQIDDIENNTQQYVDNILDFDVNNILETETFGIIDFSKIKDDYLKKRNMEFFMILDNKSEISIKKFHGKIAGDTLVLLEYEFNGRIDYRIMPLAVLSSLLDIEDKSYELILKQFMEKFGYKIKEELDGKKHYRGLQNAA